MDQAPGAESVAGVCLLLRAGESDWLDHGFHFCPRPENMPPGYRVELLATFEHPVDTRERDFQKAFRLALTDLPLPGDETVGEHDWPFPSRNAPDWMLHPKDPGGVIPPPFALHSRARRWQGTWFPNRGGRLTQTELQWKGADFEPAVEDKGSPWTEAMARLQASLFIST